MPTKTTAKPETETTDPVATVPGADDAKALMDQAREAFFQLGRRIALGEEPTAKTIAAVLADARKTTDELADLVACLKHRAELRTRVAAAARLERRRDELLAAIAQANAELEVAVGKHERTVKPHREEFASVEDELSRTTGLPVQLARCCPCPVLNRAAASIDRAISEALKTKDGARRELGRVQAAVNHCDPADRRKLAPRVERAQNAVDEAERALVELQARADENFSERVNF